MKSDTTEFRRPVHRRVIIRHRGRVKTWRDKITLAAALAELGGDAEANIGRLRPGQTLHRQRRFGRSFPVYVRMEYSEDVRPTPRTERLAIGTIDPMNGSGPTL